MQTALDYHTDFVEPNSQIWQEANACQCQYDT